MCEDLIKNRSTVELCKYLDRYTAVEFVSSNICLRLTGSGVSGGKTVGFVPPSLQWGCSGLTNALSASMCYLAALFALLAPECLFPPSVSSGLVPGCVLLGTLSAAVEQCFPAQCASCVPAFSPLPGCK